MCVCVCVCSTLGLFHFKVTEKVILFHPIVVQEKRSLQKCLTHAAGVSVGVFWISAFLWDLVRHLYLFHCEKKLSSRCCLKRLLIRATHNNFDLKRLIRLPIIFLQVAYLFVLLLVMLILLLINLPILAGGYLSIFCLLFLYG